MKVKSVRIHMTKEKDVEYCTERVSDPATAATLFMNMVGSTDREYCVVLALDAKSIPVAINTVSIGSVSASIVHPREVFKPLILSNASAFILIHNHPSGDLSPSPEDLELTNKLVSAGQMMGIRMLDHVIVGDEGYKSLSECGYLA